MLLPEALRLIRVFHDLKQNELASRFGISKSYLSEIESGKKEPSIELIEKYSEEFGIPASSIIFFSENLSSPGRGRLAAEHTRGAIAGKIISFLHFIEERTNHGDSTS